MKEQDAFAVITIRNGEKKDGNDFFVERPVITKTEDEARELIKQKAYNLFENELKGEFRMHRASDWFFARDCFNTSMVCFEAKLPKGQYENGQKLFLVVCFVGVESWFLEYHPHWGSLLLSADEATNSIKRNMKSLIEGLGKPINQYSEGTLIRRIDKYSARLDFLEEGIRYLWSVREITIKNNA